jgi:hypothetical protein
VPRVELAARPDRISWLRLEAAVEEGERLAGGVVVGQLGVEVVAPGCG